MAEQTLKTRRADKLVQFLKDRALNMPDGERFPSVRQIMDEYTVSQFTVKEALARLSESGCIYAKARSGYFVNRQRRSGIIVSLLPNYNLTYNVSFTGELIQHISEISALHGFSHKTVYYKDNAEAFEKMKKIKADAIVFYSMNSDSITADQVSWLMGMPIPVVFMNCTIPIENCRSVDSDNTVGGMLAASHLLINGHRRIGLLKSEPDMAVVRRRVNGFVKTVQAHGAELDILECDIKSGDPSHEKAYESVMRYLDRGPLNISALFVISEGSMSGALNALRERGVAIPDELSLITFGRSNPPFFTDIDMTAVDGCRRKIAQATIQIIKGYFEEKTDTPQYIEIDPEIYIGNTVKNLLIK